MALLIGKTYSFYHPEAKTLPQQHSAAQGGQGVCASGRCSGSQLLGGFGGSTEASSIAASSGIPPGPKSNSPGDGGGQRPSRVGRLGVSILLSKPAWGLGAAVAKLGPSSIFASVISSQLASGPDQPPTAQQRWVGAGPKWFMARSHPKWRCSASRAGETHTCPPQTPLPPVFSPCSWNRYSAGDDGKRILHP